jgi:hypothetical protein
MGEAHSPLADGPDMPISTQCPKCQTVYKLKDELLGKRVACADKACRTSFEVVPYVPPPKPMARPMDAEAIALAALGEEPDAATAVPEDLRKIKMTCAACDHLYEVAWAMQGKNALCPECKNRQKVPEQAAGSNKIDWRNPNAKRPSLAKQEDVPDDVWGSKQGVSVGALKEAGAIKGVEYEPRPASFFVKWGVIAFVVVFASGAGGWYLYKSSKQGSQLKLIDDAAADFAAYKDAGVPPSSGKAVEGLFHAATAEFHSRLNTEAGLKTAIQKIAQARQCLQDPVGKGADRDAVAADLIPLVVSLGGDAEAIKGGTRIPWAPGEGPRKSGALSKTDQTVVTELQAVFAILMTNGAEAEARYAALRRAVRELDSSGKASLADSLIGTGFRDDERNEATAVVALERAMASGDAAKASEEGENLKINVLGPADNLPPAAYALWQFANTPGASKGPVAPSGGPPSLSARLTHTLLNLAKKQDAEALAVASLPGPVDEQLRALALVAERSAAAPEAVAAAAKLLATPGPRSAAAGSVYARLARAAGAAGNDAAADAFAGAIVDDGLKVWARGDAHRARFAANATTKADDPTPPPDDPKKLRAGQALAKLAAFRHNVRVANSGLEAQAKALPAGTLRPFAFLGLALGAQDGAVR